MLPIIGIDQIKARSEAIGIRLKRLAQMAGVDPATAYKGAKGQTDPRTGTVRKLLETLERQERHVRRHLAELERTAGGHQLDMLDKRGNA